MKAKRTAICLLSIISLNITSPIVSATTFEMKTLEPSVEQTYTANQIQSADQYVIVENNQFRLSLPENTQYTTEFIEFINDKLQKTNDSITKNGLAIDTTTKAIYNPNLVSFRVTKSITVTNHWWGVKYRSSNYNGTIDLRTLFQDNVAAAAAAAAVLGVLTAEVYGVGGILPALDGYYNQLIVNQIQAIIDKGEATKGVTVDVNSWVPHYAVYKN